MRKALLIIFVSFLLNTILYTQFDPQQMKLGYSLGINSLKYGQADALYFGYSSSIVGNYRTKRKFFHALGGLGISYLNTSSSRFISGRSLLLDDPYTIETEMVKKCLYVEIPVKMRALLATHEMYRNEIIVPMVEFGLNIQFPIYNKSTYWQHETNSSSWTSETFELHYEGDLKLTILSPFMSLGFIIANKYTFTYQGALIVSSSKNEDHVRIYSGLSTLSFSYFHNGLLGR